MTLRYFAHPQNHGPVRLSRLIGIRWNARHGRSDPQRQTRRHFFRDQTGRCLRAKVIATADRYSSKVTIAPLDRFQGACWPGAPPQADQHALQSKLGLSVIEAERTERPRFT